jgi:predicted dehydrogenase
MIRVGFIGCGRIADLHYPGYANNPDATLAAVCDVDEESVERRCREWKIEKGFAHFADLLADPSIDAVEILTPQPFHEPMTLAALAAGKHVACQKPMTISLESADRMIRAANESGLIFKVTDNYLFYPPIVLAKKMIDDGVIGDAFMLRMKFIGGLWQGGWEVPASSWAWRLREVNEGRGIQTFDHGHHMWATAWHLMGEVERVTAWIDRTAGFIDCPAVIMWKFRKPGTYAICDYCQAVDMPLPSKYYSCDEWFEITGSRGIIMVRRCTGNLLDGPAVSVFTEGKWTHYDPESDWASGFPLATRNFIAAIQGKEDPLLTGPQAKEILRFAFALQKSNAERREVALDEL